MTRRRAASFGSPGPSPPPQPSSSSNNAALNQVPWGTGDRGARSSSALKEVRVWSRREIRACGWQCLHAPVSFPLQERNQHAPVPFPRPRGPQGARRPGWHWPVNRMNMPRVRHRKAHVRGRLPSGTWADVQAGSPCRACTLGSSRGARSLLCYGLQRCFTFPFWYSFKSASVVFDSSDSLNKMFIFKTCNLRSRKVCEW